MSETVQENQEEKKSKSAKYTVYAISICLTGFLLWSVYNETVRSIVFWAYLVLMVAMVLAAFAAFKEIKVGFWQIFNLTVQIIIIGTIVYALINPEHGSKVAVLLLGLHVFQYLQNVLVKHFKTERRTEERKGAMHRRD